MAVAYVKYLGDTSNKSAGTTLGQVLQGGGSAAGNLIVARVIFDNAATASKPIVSSISKMAGETNNWVFLGAARSTSTTAGAFASGEMWCIQTTVAWSGTITVTLDTSVTQKAVLMEEFSGTLAVARSTVGTNYSTSTTAASATTTGTTPVIGDLAIGLLWGSNVAAQQAGDTDTTAGAWSARAGLGSTGGSGATNNFGLGQYKILTAATHQTFNNSALMTAGNGSIVAILQAAPEPSISQAAYQFFDDAGTESGAASLGALNTGITPLLVGADGYGALRIRLQATTAVAVPASDWQLQWEKNASGSWTNVSTGGNTVIAYDNPNLTATGPTTNRLGAGTGSFVTGEVCEDGVANALGWTASNYTELLFALRLQAAQLAGGDVLRFRVLRNGVTTTMTYSVTPTITIKVPVAVAGSSDGGSSITGTLDVALPAVPAIPGTRALEDGSQRSTESGVPRALESYVPAGPVALAGSSAGVTTIGAGTANLGYRLFNGSSDGLTVNIGNLASTSLTPTTWIFAGRFLGLGVLVASGGYGAVDWFVDTGPDLRWYDGSSASPDDQPVLPGTTVDVLCVFRLPSSGVMRHSLATHNGTSWSSFTHADSGWDPGNPTLPSSGVLQVGFGMSEAWINARFAALAVCNTVLSDADVNTLTTDLAAWQALASLTNLWRFDQTPVVDLEGTATQNTLTGTTVTAGAFPLLGAGGGGIDLLVTRGLAGAANGTSTATGALAVTRALASTTTAGTSTASATRVDIARALTAVVPAGTSTTTATKLDKAIPIAATATASSTATATTLVKIVLLAGSAGGSSTAGATTAVARALAGTTGGLSTTTAATAVARALIATSTGLSSDTGVSTVTRGLASSADGTSTTVGALDITKAVVTLAGSADGTSTAAGSQVAVAKALAGTSTASSTATAAAQLVARGLAGTAGATSTTTAALARSIPVTAVSANGSSTATGTLIVSKTLVGSAAASSSTTGALIAARTLTAPTVTGTSTTTGTLAAARPLAAASANGGSTTTGAFIVTRPFVASASGISTTTGALVVARALVATADGAATTSANMVASAAGGLSAFVVGSSTATGSLRVARSLAGSTSGLSTGTAITVVKAVQLTASTGGLSTTVASAAVARRLAGSSTGASTVTGSFVGAVSMAATSGGITATTGSLAKTIPIAGSTTGGSTAPVALLRLARALEGSTSGLSTASAATRIALSLIATTDGISTADATAVLKFGLVGLTEGRSTANGDLVVVFIVPTYGMWNGQFFDAMQYGDKAVVEWFMVPT